jgi:hypothetical protein
MCTDALRFQQANSVLPVRVPYNDPSHFIGVALRIKIHHSDTPVGRRVKIVETGVRAILHAVQGDERKKERKKETVVISDSAV